MIRTVPNDEFFAVVLSTLEEGCTASIPVKGNSMLPFIVPEKDQVVLETVTGELKKGDIILFRYKDNYVLHRLLEVDGKSYIMMGDGNISGKEICQAEDIKAKAIIIRKVGREVNPYSPSWMRKWRLWMFLKPVRRYLLFIIRRCI